MLFTSVWSSLDFTPRPKYFYGLSRRIIFYKSRENLNSIKLELLFFQWQLPFWAIRLVLCQKRIWNLRWTFWSFYWTGWLEQGSFQVKEKKHLKVDNSQVRSVDGMVILALATSSLNLAIAWKGVLETFSHQTRFIWSPNNCMVTSKSSCGSPNVSI